MGSMMVPYGGSLYPVDLNNRLFPPNAFNTCIDRETAIWRYIQKCGGLQVICKGHKYTDPPWVKMPGQGKRFGHPSSITLPAADGADHLVQSFIVPYGYDGCIVAPVNVYTGQGFEEGSGVLSWRIKLNMRWVKDYGNIQTTLGSLTQPYYNANSQILLLSGQLVQYFVNRQLGDLTLTGGRIICALFGWYWPR
jgi:hypothetical protein